MTREIDAVGRTALLAAALRAEETKRPDRLFEDPYAERLAGEIGYELLEVLHGITYPATGTRTVFSSPDHVGIRTRFFDGFLRHAADMPATRQVVLGAAGMDARAYRLEWPERIRFFEIDRPAVLEYKQNRLEGLRPRVDRRTVPADLVSDDWEADLEAAGYDPELPSAWLIEGLLYYLPEPEAHRLLDRIAALMAPGSVIASDVCNNAALTCSEWRPMWDMLKDWGCPALFSCDDPEELFAKHGFDVRAVLPGDGETAQYNRWDDPVPLPSQAGAPRLYYLHGKRR
ncbi:SAM-dependent methyltransferase [Streptomyces sp. NBC_00320]|uniref:class I SAM-dependent methyltransferase n=1 Tax=Streptomyces sp. NBC_00320 TaxID=2975711 RepID=UPI00224E37B8|nr:SAM-dependent methyltransferase [Streptomyces sp. NBC_00320]MCX5150882.1 SAM-dependent methyltransferase [Streptomyces sp. NBC_00320]